MPCASSLCLPEIHINEVVPEMKRKLVLTSAVVLILALLAAGTFAYFTKNARATNVITTGTISIQLNDSIAGGTEKENGWTLSGVMPGQAVEKAVSVTNTGTSPAWLRVKLDLSVTGAHGKPLDLTFGNGEQVLTFTPQMKEGKGWFLAEDGYYYYSKPVAADAETERLFQSGTLMLNPQLPNDYQGCAVTVAVQAQAVQVKNNNIYVDASGAEVMGENGLPLTFDTLSTEDGNETRESSLDSVFGWPAD